MALILQHKVYAYVTQGPRLLVLRHPGAPEAGLQLPGGSLEEGEAPAVGALREAAEETGLGGLRLVAHLGTVDFPVPALGRLFRRHFFHLVCDAETPERWHHDEATPSDGTPGPIPLEFFWVALPGGVPPMAPGHDVFLPALCARLGLTAAPAPVRCPPRNE
jgi:8-oxo-dGTP diphosphatase